MINRQLFFRILSAGSLLALVGVGFASAETSSYVSDDGKIRQSFSQSSYESTDESLSQSKDVRIHSSSEDAYWGGGTDLFRTAEFDDLFSSDFGGSDISISFENSDTGPYSDNRNSADIRNDWNYNSETNSSTNTDLLFDISTGGIDVDETTDSDEIRTGSVNITVETTSD